MTKRIPPTRKSSEDKTADEGTQYEQHALTHEDGDAETTGAQPSASERAGDVPPHEARQSAVSDVHTASATVHAGSRGPSPADTKVRDDVRKALSEARDLEVSHVDVTVTSGLVLLTGHVPERWMQHVVQTVVSKVPGVRGVDNQLHERREKAMSRPGESQEGHKI
ncbi:BON domain-containing protein [Pandoraea bronchicola]|uniref:Transport-associated protein n=1 Tax=Pandoraea bronchicola TaxID=2508287 RepID=A0A5E5BLA3_9BURK|nr:BON domain-containing protein [Pandoraea bronchicola]VVE87031.1 transport-associated protein [Pandoraea bronchicola]